MYFYQESVFISISLAVLQKLILLPGANDEVDKWTGWPGRTLKYKCNIELSSAPVESKDSYGFPKMNFQVLPQFCDNSRSLIQISDKTSNFILVSVAWSARCVLMQITFRLYLSSNIHTYIGIYILVVISINAKLRVHLPVYVYKMYIHLLNMHKYSIIVLVTIIHEYYL